MKFKLENLLCAAMTFTVEYFFIVASDHVAPNHCIRLADDFKHFTHLVKRGHHDAVFELDDHHVLPITPFKFSVSDELGVLNLVIVEPSAKSLSILCALAVNFSSLILFFIGHVRNPT